MFLNYRIRRLEFKADLQNCLVAQLAMASAGYENSYYTDRHIEAVAKWFELDSKLRYLKSKRLINLRRI